MKNYMDLYRKAEECYENENYAKAIECFEKLYILNPTNTIRNYIACCYIGLNQLDKAEGILVSLTKTCHWETVYYNLARVYMKKNNDVAFTYLNRAVVINPRNEDCYFYLGVFYEKAKEYEKAIENYSLAVQLSDKDEDISMYLNNISVCYNKMNDYENAFRYCSQALEKDENNADAKYNRVIFSKLKRGK